MLIELQDEYMQKYLKTGLEADYEALLIIEDELYFEQKNDEERLK